jgi:putative heme-binding domain-containing protein
MTPRVRQAAMEAIFSRRSWIRALLDQIEQHQFDVRDIELWRAQTLLAFDDPDIRRRASQLLGARQVSNRQQIIDAYASTNQLSGDINQGRQWFRKVCSTCHQLEGQGDEIGPNLATLKNRGAEVILVNILDPNRQLDPAFENYVIQTLDGRMASGIIASETATSITLRRAGQATETILRRQIEQMRNTRQSIMPEGLEQEIDHQAMADLIAYLLAVE